MEKSYWSYLFCFVTTNKEVWPPSFYQEKLDENVIFSWSSMLKLPWETSVLVLSIILPLILRIILFIIGVTFAAIDFDGEAYKNPEKMVFVMLCLYFGLSTIFCVLKRIANINNINFFNNTPFVIKFAWFCYDIAIPSAFSTAIIYFSLATDQREMTKRLYGLNLTAAIIEILFNKMILLPNHMLWYNLFVIPYGLYYAYSFNATGSQIFVGFVIIEISYVFVHFITYIRSHFFRCYAITYPIIQTLDASDFEENPLKS
jgi:hypothetical protein